MDAAPVDIVDRVKVVEVERDTCYACPSGTQKAYVFATLRPSDRLPNGGSVAYCYHHGTRFLGGLYEAGAIVVDLRHLLEAEER